MTTMDKLRMITRNKLNQLMWRLGWVAPVQYLEVFERIAYALDRIANAVDHSKDLTNDGR